MKKYLTFILCALSLCTYGFLQIAPHFPYWIETYYARGLNHYTTMVISHLTGLFPFSVVEIGTYTLILYVIIHILYRLYHIFKKPASWKRECAHWFLQTLNLACLLWIILSSTWLINYSRVPLEESLKLKNNQHSKEDLISLYAYLIADLNQLRPLVQEDQEGYMISEGGYQSVFQRAPKVYERLSKDYPLFQGDFGRPKSFLISPLMNYTGLTGIYAPFTREANINTAILPQTIPSTTLHEMAHQRGFTEEDACNFIAYLASTYAEDADIRYSGTLLALAYTSQTLAKTDRKALVTLNQTIDEKVMKDIEQNNAFWASYEGHVEKVSSSLNHAYLKANGVSDGIQSYGRMVDLLLDYYVTYIKP